MTEIERIQDEIEILQKETSVLCEKSMVLEKVLWKEIGKYIVTNDVLNEASWDFSSKCTNLYSHSRQHPKLDEAIGWSGGWEHASLDIDKRISVRRDDGDLSICFDNYSDMVDFIEQYSLTVNFTSFDKRKKELQTELTDLRKIETIFIGKK